MIFHRDIGFPSTYRKPGGDWPTMLSRHTREREAEKGFTVPEKIEMSKFDVIEIEMIGTKLTKMVLRGEYNEYDDIIVVVIPQGHAFFVKTAWLNAWNDNHRTLDVTKYGRP